MAISKGQEFLVKYNDLKTEGYDVANVANYRQSHLMTSRNNAYNDNVKSTHVFTNAAARQVSSDVKNAALLTEWTMERSYGNSTIVIAVF